jgi:hypothetical protein
VIGKISAPRGERVEPLVYYLYGPGRREEHTDPHIVAGWWHPAELEPPLRADGKRDFRRLLGLLRQPHAAMGTRAMQRPVWHCAVRAAPQDRMLSDEEWAQIACDVMHRTGLAPLGQEDDAVRWIAVRHGDDHIHIVAMLARQDRRRPRLSNDRHRVREACLVAEERYGLRRTAAGDRTAAPPPSRAESEKAARNGRSQPPRVTLRRAVNRAAAAAGSEREFFALLRSSGVLVRTRDSSRNPGEVTGYAVALDGDTGRLGQPVWFGGGKLAPDLTLPKLRARWPGSAPLSGLLSPTERAAAWGQVLRAVDTATAHIRQMASGDPDAASDAAWAASGTMHAAAALLGSRVLREAADAYDRAARAPYGRVPALTQAGSSLRAAARLLSVLAFVSGDPSLRPVLLVARLAVLAEAVGRMRQSQERAAQAAGALAAAQRMREAVAEAQPARVPDAAASANTTAGLAGTGFPAMPGAAPRPSAAPPPRRPPSAPSRHPPRPRR